MCQGEILRKSAADNAMKLLLSVNFLTKKKSRKILIIPINAEGKRTIKFERPKNLINMAVA